MGRLTTHVLDTSAGRPAGGIRIELFRLDGGVREKLTEATTNDDGRCDAPLLDDVDFRCGEYELLFDAGAYFEATGVTLPEPKFCTQYRPLAPMPISWWLAINRLRWCPDEPHQALCAACAPPVIAMFSLTPNM